MPPDRRRDKGDVTLTTPLRTKSPFRLHHSLSLSLFRRPSPFPPRPIGFISLDSHSDLVCKSRTIHPAFSKESYNFLYAVRVRCTLVYVPQINSSCSSLPFSRHLSLGGKPALDVNFLVIGLYIGGQVAFV